MKKLFLLFASVCLAVAILAENKLALIVSNGQNEEAAVFLSDHPVLTIANNNLVITPAMGTAIQLPLTTSMTYRVEMRNDPNSTTEPQRAFLPPTMGWSSWNSYHCDINQSLIKSQADAIVAVPTGFTGSFRDAGYNYINVDDCYQNNRDASGNLQINTTLFPDMAGLVAYIHGLGLKAGIYSDAGTQTCAKMYQKGHANSLGGATAGLYQHEAADCEYFFNTLGFDFIKVDYCGAEDLGLDQQTRYTAIKQAIQNATPAGKYVALNMCCWKFPGSWAAGVADSWRTTGDIVSGWSLNSSDNVTTSQMKGVKEIIKENLYLSAYCGGGHYNDMDMLEVGVSLEGHGPLTAVENQTHFAMWCIMSSPLLIGCDLNTVSDENRRLLCNEELIALNQDPLGLQAYVAKRMTSSTGAYVDAYVLVKDVETLHGTKRAVAFCNLTDAAVNMSIDFADIDLGGSVAIRDLLAKSNVGTLTDNYSVNVPAHGTKIYTFDAEQRLPRRRYEAETAWLDGYQELKNNQGTGDSNCPITAIHEQNANCSGGVCVGWLGQSAKNDVQWRDVWVVEEADYEVTFSVLSAEDRSFKVRVNEDAPVTLSANSGSWTATTNVTTTLHLNAGTNTVRIYNDASGAAGNMPSVDYMEINISGNAVEPTDPNEENLGKIRCTISPSTNTALFVTTNNITDSNNQTTYGMETTAEYFELSGNDADGWTFKSMTSGKWIGKAGSNGSYSEWNVGDNEFAWDIADIAGSEAKYIWRHGTTGDNQKGLGWDDTATAGSGVYSDKKDSGTAHNNWMINKSIFSKIEYYLHDTKVSQYYGYLAIGATMADLAENFKPEGYDDYELTCVQTTVTADCSTYRVNMAQYITLNFIDVQTGAVSTQAIELPAVGTDVLTLGTQPDGFTATYYTRKPTPASVITEGVTEYNIYYNEPNYAITGGVGNCNNTSNRTQSFDVTAGSAAAVTIGDMQTAFNQALYWNKTDVVVPCNAGETITISNWRGSKVTGMQAYVYLDVDGDGFSCTPNNAAHTVSGDLMSWTTYSFGSGNWYRHDGTQDDTAPKTNSVSYPMTFTAPTTPGVYRMRYKVDWNSIDAAGASGIKGNGGVIVDFLLEVQQSAQQDITITYVNTYQDLVSGQTKTDTFSKTITGTTTDVIGSSLKTVAQNLLTSGFYTVDENEARTITAASSEYSVNVTADFPFNVCPAEFATDYTNFRDQINSAQYLYLINTPTEYKNNAIEMPTRFMYFIDGENSSDVNTTLDKTTLANRVAANAPSRKLDTHYLFAFVKVNGTENRFRVYNLEATKVAAEGGRAVPAMTLEAYSNSGNDNFAIGTFADGASGSDEFEVERWETGSTYFKMHDPARDNAYIGRHCGGWDNNDRYKANPLFGAWVYGTEAANSAGSKLNVTAVDEVCDYGKDARYDWADDYVGAFPGNTLTGLYADYANTQSINAVGRLYESAKTVDRISLPANETESDSKYYQLYAYQPGEGEGTGAVKVLYAAPNHSQGSNKKADTTDRDIKLGNAADIPYASTLFQIVWQSDNYDIRHANSDYWFPNMNDVANGAVVNLVNDEPATGLAYFLNNERGLANVWSIHPTTNKDRYFNWSAGTNAKAVDASPADTDEALWLIKEVKEVPVKVGGAAKWSTICLPMAVKLSESEDNATCELYYVPTENFSSAGHVKLVKYDASTVIPAGTPLLVLNTKTGTDDATFRFDIVTETGTALTGNALEGTTARRVGFTTGSVYGLANKNGVVGFYLSTSTAVAANKAYLPLANVSADPNEPGSGPANVLRFGFDGDVATGIGSIVETGNQEYYDLNGRRVMYPVHGVYVTKDGTKVLFR